MCPVECVVVKTPLMTDSIEEEGANKINIKVQGNDADSKKTFQVLKVKRFDNIMTVLGAVCNWRGIAFPKHKTDLLYSPL